MQLHFFFSSDNHIHSERVNKCQMETMWNVTNCIGLQQYSHYTLTTQFALTPNLMCHGFASHARAVISVGGQPEAAMHRFFP